MKNLVQLAALVLLIAFSATVSAALDVTAIAGRLINVQSVAETVAGFIFSLTGMVVIVGICLKVILTAGGGKRGRSRSSTGSRRTSGGAARYGRSYGRQSYRNHVYDR